MSTPDLTPRQRAAPDGLPDASPSAAADRPPGPVTPPDRPDEDAEADARTPDEYTEPPGSHRRPSDGAALDVGG